MTTTARLVRLTAIVALAVVLAGAAASAATVTATIGLRIRACPDLACSITTVMPYGAQPTVLSGPYEAASGGDWYEVSWNGWWGYSHGWWLALGGTVTTATLPAAPAPAPAPAPSGNWYLDTVYQAAAAYGVSGDWLWAVHGCETGYTYRHDLWGPNGEYGPFQYHQSTWDWFSTESGIGGSIFDAGAQAWVTAWAFANGYAGHWVCA